MRRLGQNSNRGSLCLVTGETGRLRGPIREQRDGSGEGEQRLREWFWPIALIIICLAGWILFSHLISYMSGWRRLATTYRATQPFSGTWMRPWAASMGWGVNYNGLINVGTDSAGIHLSIFFLFRAGHPPLLIPFGDVSAMGMRTWRTFWFSMAKLEFRRCPSAYLLIPLKAAEKLSQFGGFPFQIEKSG